MKNKLNKITALDYKFVVLNGDIDGISAWCTLVRRHMLRFVPRVAVHWEYGPGPHRRRIYAPRDCSTDPGLIAALEKIEKTLDPFKACLGIEDFSVLPYPEDI
jgi:hypothetical protein